MRGDGTARERRPGGRLAGAARAASHVQHAAGHLLGDQSCPRLRPRHHAADGDHLLEGGALRFFSAPCFSIVVRVAWRVLARAARVVH
eukprot:7354771-Pyramimonas_sp.AAC.1